MAFHALPSPEPAELADPIPVVEASAAGRLPSLVEGKLILRDRVKALAGIQDGGREFRLIRGIGKMLGFQAKRGALRIGSAALARRFPIEKIPGVKLHAGLGSPNFEDPASSGLEDAGGEIFSMIHRHPQDKVVVVAAAKFQLLAVLIDAPAEC